MEEKDIKEVEENKEETTAVDETVETVRYAGHGIYLDGESPSWGLSSQ